MYSRNVIYCCNVNNYIRYMPIVIELGLREYIIYSCVRILCLYQYIYILYM